MTSNAAAQDMLQLMIQGKQNNPREQRKKELKSGSSVNRPNTTQNKSRIESVKENNGKNHNNINEDLMNLKAGGELQPGKFP